jgi:hypothetical protein
MIEKRMQEYRHTLGDFEVVDCVEPEAIERIRGHLRIDAPVTVNWQWEYGSEVAELRALYEKSKANQWNAATDLDWDTPVTSSEWIVRPEASQLAMACRLAGKDEKTQRQAAFDEVGFLLSQLLHGEQAALQLCGQLTNLCSKTDEKWYAAAQVADEARHNEVFARFIGEKMGTLYPIGATVKALLDELLSVEGYEMKTLGMQTLFEGVAVGIMDLLREESQNPLFSELLRRVQQDESRHAAFGVLTMRRVVRDADQEQRERMEDWAFGILETLNANQQLDMLRLLCPKYGLDPVNVALLPRMAPNWVELNSAPFMHTVVPNLQRLGLITERTEPQWRRLGIMSDVRGPMRRSIASA